MRTTRTAALLLAATIAGAAAPSAAVHGDAAGALTLVASGLNNPRGLAIAADGSLYVAEAGMGGAGPCITGESGRACFGLSGAIVHISGGQTTTVVSHLPSAAGPGGAQASGPSDLLLDADGSMTVTMQGVDMATPSSFGSQGSLLQHVLRVDKAGAVQPIADLYGYEKSNNPDGREINSDPYALVAHGTQVVVVDAAANDLLAVDAAGSVSTLAVFPSRMVPGPAGKLMPMETVPDAIAVGPDGAYYVGELTGFPFPLGGARIYRVVPGQRPTVYAIGFTNIIALAFGPDRSLYVLEIFQHGLRYVDPKQPATLAGELVRLAPDGTRTVLAQRGLVAPAGLAISPGGTIYVSNFGAMPHAGQVVRVTP
jgi:hypothetical protein